MTASTRRQDAAAESLEAAKQVVTGTQASDVAPKPTKPQTPMAEAVKLQGALDKINKRETEALTNAKARYQAERDVLLGVASDKAKKILEAAAVEETVA